MKNEKQINIPTVEEMFEAGCHMGHRSRHWHPKMKPYIYSTYKGIHIINLEKTRAQLEKACDFLYSVAKSGKKVVFVGTKEQSRDIVKSEAVQSSALYVIERFLGGTFTNFDQIKKNINKFVDLQVKLKDGTFNALTKKERLLISREIEKMSVSYAGLVGLTALPGAVVVVDAKREKTAVSECSKVDVPVIALIDTNTNCESIAYPIACNDDAIKSVALILRPLSEAVKKGSEAYLQESKEMNQKLNVKAGMSKPNAKNQK